jgi:glycosyltransferase involved in cell wall biosynthesis
MALPTYAVITPVRDESEHLSRTAGSMIAQNHRPEQWIVVDDGSTDDTRAIAERFAAEHGWIRVIATGSKGRRARGAPIVRAFEAGRRALDRRPDFVVKMDGDLFLPAHYFEWVARTFERVPQAGIAGGLILAWDGRRWIPDYKGAHSVGGGLKAYRTDCLEAIGGLRESMGWDGIDEYGARSRGWWVLPLTELSSLHYGLRGEKLPWAQARWEEGVATHFMGYLWRWALVRAAYRAVVERPKVLGGVVLGLGFAWSRLTRRPMVDDEQARAALRDEQRERFRGLLRGSGALDPTPIPGGGPAFWAGEEPERETTAAAR